MVVVGLHICVRVGRVDQYEKRKKLREEKKLPLVRYRLDSQRVQVTGRLPGALDACVYVCVCASARDVVAL